MRGSRQPAPVPPSGVCRRTRLGIAAVCLGLASGCASSRSFASPDEAVREFVSALRPYDAGRLRGVLGADADGIIRSGDEVSDRHDLAAFLDAYDARHRLVTEPDGSLTLEVGEDDWPMPIPLVKSGRSWRFDMQRGREEILARRIGRNELSAIQVCRAIVDAQREYARTDPDGNGVDDYAQKFFSDPGRRNGLYWEAPADQPRSPLGVLVAAAQVEGYSTAAARRDTPQPYHGYCYRMLTGQGPAAPGGARSYLSGASLTGGFAVVAYPAAYDDSGIMTFIVNQTGLVYEQDLGRNTDHIARTLSAFDPGPGWTLVQHAD